MSAHVEVPADLAGGTSTAPHAVPAAAQAASGADPAVAVQLRAVLQRRGISRSLAALRDPVIVFGAVILGIGLAAWIYDDLWSRLPIPFDAPFALAGATIMAGQLGARRVRQRTSHLDVLRAASARMSRATTIESVGRAIVEETGRILDYHNARVYVLEPPDQVVPIAFEGRVGAYEQVDFELLRTVVGQGFTGWVALHGEALLIDDANRDPRGATIAGTDDVDESMLVVPMRYDDQIVGVITLSKLGLHQFDGEDLRLLSTLADQAATALETAKLLARSEHLAAELRRLVDMSSALSRSLDPRQVAELMARHLATAIGADECAISAWDKATDRVVTMGYHPPQPPGDLADSFDLTDFPATRLVLVDEIPLTVAADDRDADPAERAFMLDQGFRSLLMLPLIAKGQAIGLVELYAVGEVRLDGTALELARTMANEAAMALENATLYERARELADRDHLTGFYNHRFLHERLGEELLRASRSRGPISLLLLDLDQFKLVNDTFGHLLGDRVLVWTAELVRSTLRVSDVPARYGGDEFAIILPETDGPAAEIVKDRILDAFATSSFQTETRGGVQIGASIGVATYPADGSTGTELIAAADQALYRGKRLVAGTHDAGQMPTTS